jgi:hypothetical protein
MMRRLGWKVMETEDHMTAVWSLSIYTLSLPASWAPLDEADLMRRVLGITHQQGVTTARNQIRQALGLGAG